jgi:hypothetical protein
MMTDLAIDEDFFETVLIGGNHSETDIAPSTGQGVQRAVDLTTRCETAS